MESVSGAVAIGSRSLAQGPKGGESVTFSDKEIEPIIMGKGGSLNIYAEMMRSLDDGVGRVMKAVKGADLGANTLVIFTSDNGGELSHFQRRAGGPSV